MSIYKFTVDGDTACMDFNPEDPKYPEALIVSSYRRERRFLIGLQDYAWCPEDLTFDTANRKIFFKWYNNTCEDQLPNNWQEQLMQIARDMHQEEFYKPSFYPKYFYTDNNGQIHAFNFYTAFDYLESPVDVDFYRPILNADREELINSISVDGKLDIKTLMYYAFNEYIQWPEGSLKTIWQAVYE